MTVASCVRDASTKYRRRVFACRRFGAEVGEGGRHRRAATPPDLERAHAMSNYVGIGDLVDQIEAAEAGDYKMNGRLNAIEKSVNQAGRPGPEWHGGGSNGTQRSAPCAM